MIATAVDSAGPAENASRFQQALGKPFGFPTDPTATTTTRYSWGPPNQHGSGVPRHPPRTVVRDAVSREGMSPFSARGYGIGVILSGASAEAIPIAVILSGAASEAIPIAVILSEPRPGGSRRNRRIS